MRALVVLMELAIVLVVAYAIYAGLSALPRARRERVTPAVRSLPAGGRWQPHHYAETGHTVVTVARMTPTGEVLEEHVVARIPDADEDWSRRFVRAKQEAEERAFHLNADG